MSFQQFSHEKLFSAAIKLTDEFRIGMIVKMCSQIVHTRE